MCSTSLVYFGLVFGLSGVTHVALLLDDHYPLCTKCAFFGANFFFVTSFLSVVTSSQELFMTNIEMSCLAFRDHRGHYGPSNSQGASVNG